VEWIKIGNPPTVMSIVLDFTYHFGIGAIAGTAGGFLLAHLLRKVTLTEELYALLLVSGGLVVFAVSNLLGGSGFMAIYLAGLIIGNRSAPATKHVLGIMDSFAWLAQAGMFLVLGLLVTPTKLLADISIASAIAVFLIVVARPIAVWLSLLPFRFPTQEIAFIGWVGLRGAVPIVLAVFPIMSSLDNSSLFFHVAFVVVLMSLLFQGTTVPIVAKLCGVRVLAQRDKSVE